MTAPPLHWANAHFVTPNLAIGGDINDYVEGLAPRQVEELMRAGITHIIDCRQEMSDADIWVGAPGVEFRWQPVDDAGQRIPFEWFDQGVGFALAALKDPDAKLLSHCHMGINRGPSLGYAVLLGLGWDPVAAIDSIRKARPIANVWYGEDALAWHHHRMGTTAQTRRADRARLRDWRDDNPLDVVRIIAGIRAEEAS